VIHQYAFFASLAALPALLLVAPSGRAAVAAAIYGATLPALFGVSALYHRITWSQRGRRWMGRLDHAMINLLIAGTFTPFGMLALSGTRSTVLLTLAWAGAIVGIVLHVLWIDAPKWISATLYVLLGWTGVLAMPELVGRVGWTATGLLALGGMLYSAGAAVYAFRRPDPAPAVFGYHEVFHALVVAAALAHYTAVVLYVVPTA
jgi:hemolysin III